VAKRRKQQTPYSKGKHGRPVEHAQTKVEHAGSDRHDRIQVAHLNSRQDPPQVKK